MGAEAQGLSDLPKVTPGRVRAQRGNSEPEALAAMVGCREEGGFQMHLKGRLAGSADG